MLKRCSRCEQSLPVERFGKRLGGLQSYCKECHIAYHKAWRKTDKGRAVIRARDQSKDPVKVQCRRVTR